MIKRILRYLFLFFQSNPLYRKLLRKIFYNKFMYQQVTISNHGLPASYRFTTVFHGRIIGKVTLVKRESKNPYPGWWIYSSEVYLPFRGMGIGEKLLKRLFNFAVEKEAKSFYLSVWDKARPACRLYKKLGFRKIGEKMVRITGENRPRQYLLMQNKFR